MTVFEVKHQLRRPPVNAVAAAANVHLAVEDEGGEGRFAVATDAGAQAGGEVAGGAEQTVVAPVVPGDEEAFLLAAGEYGLGAGLVVAAAHAFLVLVQSVVGKAGF